MNDIASIKTPSYAGKISKPDILLDEGEIKDVKRQDILAQIYKNPDSPIELKDIKPGQGL